MNSTWHRILPASLRNYLKGHQVIIGNIGWLLADKVFRMGLGLFVGVWVTRYLGPHQFGSLSYASSFVALFASFAALGLDSIVVRDIVRYPLEKDEILATAFALKLTGGAVSFVVALTAISYFRPGDTSILWLVGIIAIGTIFQAFNTVDLWFQSQVQSKFTVWTSNTAFIIISIIKICLIIEKAPLIAFACASLGEIVLGSIGLIFAFKLKGYSLKIWHFTFRRVRKLLKDSWPLILSSIMVTIYMRIDQLMLGGMQGDKSVGIFSAAVRLSEVWYILPGIIASSLFPSLVNSKQMGDRLYHERFQKYYDLNAIIAYGIILVTFFFAPVIVSTLYGDQYAESGAVFSMHIWGFLFVSLGVSREQYFLSEGLMRYSFLCTFIGCLSNILLNLILIPRYGPFGAALATVISFGLAGYISSFIFPKLYYIGLMQSKALIAPFRLLFGQKAYLNNSGH